MCARTDLTFNRALAFCQQSYMRNRTVVTVFRSTAQAALVLRKSFATCACIIVISITFILVAAMCVSAYALQ